MAISAYQIGYYNRGPHGAYGMPPPYERHGGDGHRPGYPPYGGDRPRDPSRHGSDRRPSDERSSHGYAIFWRL